jgi:hypothetical protein
MDRRATRAREYYAFALIAGISVSDARRMTPGFITDMFKLRAKYDTKLAQFGMMRRMF